MTPCATWSQRASKPAKKLSWPTRSKTARSAGARWRAASTTATCTTRARAATALERGHGVEATQMLGSALKSTLPRDDELALRGMLAEAWLQQDDLDQAGAALGRAPDTFRDAVAPVRLATLWRLHGRLASARGDQSRAIALHGRALKQAEAAHEPRAIGLAHYELAQCYRQAGDPTIVRDHLSKAASP